MAKLHDFNRWKKVGLALAIMIVFNLFVNVGIYTFYKGPKYDDYCSANIVAPTKEIKTEARCTELNGSWQGGYCDLYTTCSDQFQSVESVYNRNVFIVLVVIGTVALIAGLFLQQVSAVANGFMFGGIISIFIGTVRYWSNMDEYLRFAILGVVLIILIWLGVSKLRDSAAVHDQKQVQ